MEFCPACGVYMPRIAATDAKIEFVCPVCGLKKNGIAEDTLWYGDSSIDGLEQSKIIIERASHDLAGLTVPFDCACGRTYITLVRIGKTLITKYICECGANYNSIDKALPVPKS
jgi:hypothetical protein